MSNDFPKVSPDGRWIVFVQNKNGLLMRPDSRLYIVPFDGGKARLMKCNTWRMNSWHTFSPNGRWLAFSSKARSPYTQLMLTHIDANGNDSPAIIVDNTTAANRASEYPGVREHSAGRPGKDRPAGDRVLPAISTKPTGSWKTTRCPKRFKRCAKPWNGTRTMPWRISPWLRR